jgi:isochorismate pyruvate lyase
MAEIKTEPADAYDRRRVADILSRIRDAAATKGLDPGLAEDLWRKLIDWNIAWEASAIGRPGGAGPGDPPRKR